MEITEVRGANSLYMILLQFTELMKLCNCSEKLSLKPPNAYEEYRRNVESQESVTEGYQELGTSAVTLARDNIVTTQSSVNDSSSGYIEIVDSIAPIT